MGLLIGILIRLLTGQYRNREQQNRERLRLENSRQDMRDGFARKLTSRRGSSKQEIRDRFTRMLQNMQNRLPASWGLMEDECLVSDVLSGSGTRPFALYLRPFALERKIQQRQDQIVLPHRLLGQLLFPTKINFDYMLQEHFHQLGLTLIKLSDLDHKIDQAGAGHAITKEFTWRHQFHQLAERAESIVIVPGYYKGIISEIRWLIATRLLVKAVFFKPAGYPKAEWKKMQKLYEENENIELPEYSHKQMSFRMYSSGRCYNVRTWKSVYGKKKQALGNAQMRATLLNKPMPEDTDQEDE